VDKGVVISGALGFVGSYGVIVLEVAEESRSM
jgi:hypothetical protein